VGLERAAQPQPHDETDPGRDTIPMDHHDRYLLPDPSGDRPGAVPWTRSSTVKGRVQNSEALKAYNEKMLAKGLAISPDLTALIASTPLSARGAHTVLMEAIEQAKIRGGARIAANFGTALHNFTEQIDMGEPLDDVLERVPESLKADVIAYVDMLERHGLTPVPEYVERVVVNTKLATGLTHDGKPGKRKDAAAGTAARFDRMYLWTDPADGVEYLIPADLKSGKNAVEYGSLETCVQIAVAVHADQMWNEDTNSYEDMPPTVGAPGSPVTDPRSATEPSLRTDFGLIIHIPVGQGRCEPEELDLVLGWKVAQLGVDLMLVDKAKPYCHRPFDGKATRTALVSAPGAEEHAAGILEARAATLREADTDVAPEPNHPDEASAAGAQADEGAAELGDTRTLDALLTAEPLDPEAIVAAARAEAKARGLKPLARDVGASRGCSQCGRTGHRSNSKVCLGIRDPEVRARKAIATAELQGRLPAKTDEAEATVPVPDGVIACGPDGAVTELTSGDAAVVQAFAEELEERGQHHGHLASCLIVTTPVAEHTTATRCTCGKGRVKACSHSSGYTLNQETGIWVCPDCGQESPQAAEARLAREAMQPRTQADAELLRGTGAVGPDVPVAEEAPEPAPAEASPEELEAVLDEALGGPRDLMAEIEECQDREDLQALRRSAMAEGIWKPEHTKAGVARLRALAP
jgi:hypothetical protein